jgi:hypothetical protein
MQIGHAAALADMGFGVGSADIDSAATQHHGHAFNRLVSNFI